jgi:uncharacterized surface protein with fasciclin (FAS1) repeats
LSARFAISEKFVVASSFHIAQTIFLTSATGAGAPRRFSPTGRVSTFVRFRSDGDFVDGAFPFHLEFKETAMQKKRFLLLTRRSLALVGATFLATGAAALADYPIRAYTITTIQDEPAPAPVVEEPKPAAPAPAPEEPKPAEPAPAPEEPKPAEPAPAPEEPKPAEPAPAPEEPKPAEPAPAPETPQPAEPTPVEEAVKDAKENVEAAAQAANEKVQEAAEVAKEKVENAIETAKENAAEAAQAARDGLEETIQKVKDEAADAAQVAKDATATAVETAKENVEKAAEVAKEKAEAVADAAKEKVDEAKNDVAKTPVKPRMYNYNASTLSCVMQCPECSIFSRAIHESGLEELIGGARRITIFAPTDGAFAHWPQESLDQLFDCQPALAAIVLNHICPESLSPAELTKLQRLACCCNYDDCVKYCGKKRADELALHCDAIADKTKEQQEVCDRNGGVGLGDGALCAASFPAPVVRCVNGYVYPIDRVQIPRGLKVYQALKSQEEQAAEETLEFELVEILIPSETLQPQDETKVDEMKKEEEKKDEKGKNGAQADEKEMKAEEEAKADDAKDEKEAKAEKSDAEEKDKKDKDDADDDQEDDDKDDEDDKK